MPQYQDVTNDYHHCRDCYSSVFRQCVGNITRASYGETLLATDKDRVQTRDSTLLGSEIIKCQSPVLRVQFPAPNFRQVLDLLPNNKIAALACHGWHI